MYSHPCLCLGKRQYVGGKCPNMAVAAHRLFLPFMTSAADLVSAPGEGYCGVIERVQSLQSHD